MLFHLLLISNSSNTSNLSQQIQNKNKNQFEQSVSQQHLPLLPLGRLDIRIPPEIKHITTINNINNSNSNNLNNISNINNIIHNNNSNINNAQRLQDFDNNNTFYTDSNGLEMQKRILNYRPTWDLQKNLEDNGWNQNITYNYYPINSAIALEDVNSDRTFTVMNDRAQGGSSLSAGTIEFM